MGAYIASAMRLSPDRVAVVTGAASGIGRALAVALAARGCPLALVDLDAEGLAATAATIAGGGRRVTTHVVDVASAEAMAALPEAVVTAHGHVHLLVNNAGVSVAGTFEEVPLEDVRWLMDINFWGVVHGCKSFLPYLRREPEAHIVNVSSVFGLVGMPENSAYCASKFAVRGLSESLWVELAETHVGLTCVHPGGVRTNIARRSRMADEERRTAMVREFDRVARTTPEQAAARIVRAVERGEMRLRLCPESYVIDWAKRLAPQWSQRLLLPLYRRTRSRLQHPAAG